MYVSLLIPSAFAQDGGIDKLVDNGIKGVVNDLTDNLDFSDPNMLNATQEETDALKDSGLEMVGRGIDLLKTAHKFAGDFIQFLSPVHVDQFILFLVAGAIAVILVISLIKRIAIHLVIFAIITLFIIGLLAYFYY